MDHSAEGIPSKDNRWKTKPVLKETNHSLFRKPASFVQDMSLQSNSQRCPTYSQTICYAWERFVLCLFS